MFREKLRSTRFYQVPATPPPPLPHRASLNFTSLARATTVLSAGAIPGIVPFALTMALAQLWLNRLVAFTHPISEIAVYYYQCASIDLAEKPPSNLVASEGLRCVFRLD